MSDMFISDGLSVFRLLTVNGILSLLGVGELSQYVLFFSFFMCEMSEECIWIFVCDCEFAHEFSPFSEGVATGRPHYNSNQISTLVTVTSFKINRILQFTQIREGMSLVQMLLDEFQKGSNFLFVRQNIYWMRNNLQIFRQEVQNHLKSQHISDIDQFKELVNYLCDVKLLHPQQVKKLIHKFGNSNQIKFPITIQQFEHIIMTNFGDKQLQQMLNDFNDLKKALRQTKGVISIWKDKGLSKRERAELQSIFQSGNQKLREFYTVLQNQRKTLEQICEQDIQMIDCLQEWVQMQKVMQPFKDYKQFQSQHQKLIQQQFNKLKVREVHFKQRINTAKISKVEIAIGLDSRNDEPVQVVLIPKRTLEFDMLNVELLTFNAKKDLMLSSHFTRFLGYNTHCDQNCFFYFNEYIQGHNLYEYINSVKIELQQETPLFKYWSSAIYKALYDIFLMSSYIPRLPITLKDMEVSCSGLKLIVKNIKFVQNRQENERQLYEAELLQNLGELVLSLLKVDSKNWQERGKVTRIQNKSIINCLLHAQNGHRNYKEGRVKSRLTFFNIQTHPLFESKNLLQGQLVMDNYQSILRYK